MNPYLDKKKTMMNELNLLKKGVRDFEEDMKNTGYETCTHLTRSGESAVMSIGTFGEYKCAICLKEMKI